VYRFAHGRLQALVRDLNRPNGLAFSPDFRVLYVNNSDPAKDLVMRYDVAADGTLSGGRVFADLTSKGAGLADGLKIDAQGNLYTSGPGGIWVLSPAGAHLGTIKTPETAVNCAWGDDGKTLYMTAVTGIYRVRTLVGR
jgi:gluconolactonase